MRTSLEACLCLSGQEATWKSPVPGQGYRALRHTTSRELAQRTACTGVGAWSRLPGMSEHTSSFQLLFPVSPSPVSFVCLQCMEEGANSLHHGKTAVQLMHTNVLQASCEIRARVTSKIGQKRIPCNTPIRAFDAHAGFQSHLGFRLTHSHKAGMAKRFFPSHIAWTSPHCRVYKFRYV